MRGLDLRQGIAGLVGFARADLDALWREVRNAAEAEVALRDILPGLIDTYGLAAGTLAADWYDDLRDKVEPKGHFRAIPADVPDTGAQALVGWAVNEAADLSGLQGLILGGMQRRIANFSRLTVMGSVVEDPGAAGWQRATDGNGCAFCSMIASRGVVFSQASADFASHDACGCVAVPAFHGEPVPVKPYTPSARNITDADRERVRAYLREH